MQLKSELIPPSLLIARYFAAEQAAIEKLEAELAAIEQEMEEMAEEHSGEEGLLGSHEGEDDKDKLTEGSSKARLKEIKARPGRRRRAQGARRLLRPHRPSRPSHEPGSKPRRKTLEAKVAAKYGKLTEDEIKTLVVDDKWLATLAAAVQGELDRVSQTLTGRIRQLAERYATPLPQLTDEVATLAARVDEHLKKMGAVWK